MNESDSVKERERERECARQSERERARDREKYVEQMRCKCMKDRRINKILLPSGLESQPMGIIKRK